MPEERANIILRFSLRKQKSGIKRGEQYTVLLVSYFILFFMYINFMVLLDWLNYAR